MILKKWGKFASISIMSFLKKLFKMPFSVAGLLNMLLARDKKKPQQQLRFSAINEQIA